MHSTWRFPARAAVLLSSVIALAVAAGCGGGGHGPSALSAPSPFVGQWAGQWAGDDGNYGMFTAAVDERGKMTVSLNEVGAGTHAVGDGKIESDGYFTVNYQFEGGPPMNGTGILTSNTTNALTGTMALRRG